MGPSLSGILFEFEGSKLIVPLNLLKWLVISITRPNYIKERGLAASDVTVRPWPPVNIFGGKYDLIQLHRQIIHQYARN